MHNDININVVYPVQDDAARFKLTTKQVQTGDTVKVISNEIGENITYLVIDDTKLNSEAGYQIYEIDCIGLDYDDEKCTQRPDIQELLEPGRDIRVSESRGLTLTYGILHPARATKKDIEEGTNKYKPIVPANLKDVFEMYGGGGGGSVTVDDEVTTDSENPVSSKAIVDYVASQLEDIGGGGSVTVDDEVTTDSENPVSSKAIVDYVASQLEDIGGGGSSADCTIQNAMTCGVSVGGVTAGKVYSAGTSIEQILRDILGAYSAPQVTLTITPDTELYDSSTDVLSNITLSAITTKKTRNITSVAFYVNDTMVNEITTSVANGGTFTFEYVPTTPMNTTTVFKAVVSDGSGQTISEKTVVFTGLSYYGTVADTITVPTEADIVGLQNSVLKNTRALTYSSIAVDYGKVLYAYPKSLGLVTKIVDSLNFDYTNSYTQGEISVNGIGYYYYILTDAMGTDNGYQKFT